MKKISYIALVVFIILNMSIAFSATADRTKLALEIEWQKCLGGSDRDCAESIIQTDDGGYIIAGEAMSNDGDVTGHHGESDYWVVKLDAKGNLEWQKCLGGTGDDMAYDVIQIDDGGCIVIGFTDSNDGDVSGNHGEEDVWIVKLDKSGNLEWQKCLGGTDNDRALSIIHTDDNEYIVAGYTSSNDGDVSGNHGAVDSWVIKLDANGNLEWQKCLGGTDDDKASSIIRTDDSGYIIAGFTHSNDGDVAGNHGGMFSYDYWIVKLTASNCFPSYFTGASLWAVPEIKQALEYNLVTDRVMSNYTTNITREEFCELVIKLYEVLSGKVANPVSQNPFKDTDNIEILKANNLKIINGRSPDRFAPSDPITRQEICVMLLRTLKAANIDIVVDNTEATQFADEDKISSWAIESVRFCSKNGIMKGVGNNLINPLGNTTKEQAIIFVKRIYEKFK